MNANDALNNPIEVGKKYGYATRAGSWVTVTIGYARKINDSGRITLEVTSTKQHLYGKIVERNSSVDGGEAEVAKRMVTTSSFLLFPVND